MTQDKTETLLFDINGRLAAIESKLDTFSDTILKHEARLTNLEKDVAGIVSQEPSKSLKDEMLRMLCKCVLVGLTAIASLAGASGLVSQIIGK